MQGEFYAFEGLAKTSNWLTYHYPLPKMSSSKRW